MKATRLSTLPVHVGSLIIGNHHPILPQTMTTTDTMDTNATVNQTIKCIEANASLVRITAPSKNEAENLQNIKTDLNNKGYFTPLVADIHFTPNAAEIAASIVEKVRINPGNFVDKKKFENIEYSDKEYNEELQRIEKRFIPLILKCKENQTAIRIGTNHGSLSDRITSRYGDTSFGMVESAMEFLRIARANDFHNIVLSMKSSNPIVMVDAYRKLVNQMLSEFGECYPLHLGVTEAGDGEDGRVKSALGIGTLLEDGIGDTIRVSLTEDPEIEIPVCQTLISKYQTTGEKVIDYNSISELLPKRKTKNIAGIGGSQPPIVCANLPLLLDVNDLSDFGYHYNADTDKWHIDDQAADVFWLRDEFVFPVNMPESITWLIPKEYFHGRVKNSIPVYNRSDWNPNYIPERAAIYVTLDEFLLLDTTMLSLPNVIWLINRENKNSLQDIRESYRLLEKVQSDCPVIWVSSSDMPTVDAQITDHTIQAGSPFLEGIGDGICIIDRNHLIDPITLAFSILQAARQRISKTEYISCPSCGRTLFDLQETTAKIRQATSHLKGVKIAIMGCIVNGPGEMADADFGYVGSGVDKITLYKGKEIMKKNVPSSEAVGELIDLLKSSGAWTEPIS